MERKRENQDLSPWLPVDKSEKRERVEREEKSQKRLEDLSMKCVLFRIFSFFFWNHIEILLYKRIFLIKEMLGIYDLEYDK